jgi:putative tricarboxylic transport membrane protein
VDIFAGILQGFQTTLQPWNLFYCFVGVFIGTLIGVLPGIGPVGTMAILLPVTYNLSPVSAIILLAGIYYGASYGCSTTSILVNIPGEVVSVVTCLDGYQMAKQGRAGPALGISAFGSLIGGTFATIALMFLVIPLADIAVKFGPVEYFSLICMSLILTVYMVSGSFAKGIISILIGLILSTVGLDKVRGFPRFTFGLPSLVDGVGLVNVAMGLFGITEILYNLELNTKVVYKTRIKNLLPNLQDWKRSAKPIVRGSLIGFICGTLPAASTISTFLSYSVEKRFSKHPEEFGHGAIEGVAGPETANNAAAGGAFVPLLAFGIPPNAIMGLLLGALMIHNVTPGPLMLTQHPEIFWGVIASMYIGNVMLLLLNLPLIGLWVKLLQVPYSILAPLILLCCLMGAYSVGNNTADIITMVIFGIVGFLMRRGGYELAPMILALLLGPIIETAFRQSLAMSGGNFFIFLEKPISAVALVIAALLVISSGFSTYRKAKIKLPQDGEM